MLDKKMQRPASAKTFLEQTYFKTTALGNVRFMYLYGLKLRIQVSFFRLLFLKILLVIYQQILLCAKSASNSPFFL